MTSTDPTAPRWRTTLALLAITLAGGALRFAWLGHPCLWGDEALVYYRTCGTYAQLLEPLHLDGFPPLHYELYWAIVHHVGHAPSPAAMRAVSAICGTLMVPAVFFLARQLLPRRPSLLAATFTAGSAFALFYSRDAKMYADAWLAMTLGVGCLLWWLRTGRATAWLGWVAGGAAAGGLQVATLISVVGLAPLLLLTQRRAHWRQSLLWLAGATLIAAGPAGYYAKFNGWVDKVDAHGWQDSGLNWIRSYNFGRTGPGMVGYTATTFLTGWEWPRPIAFDHMPDGRAWALRLGAVAVVGILLAGLLPWPRRWLPLPTDPAPVPPWRAGLWLAAWIVLPTYGFYCRSMVDFASPVEMLGLAEYPTLWIVVAVVIAYGLALGITHRPSRPSAVRWAQGIVVTVCLVAACQAIATVMAAAAAKAAAAGRPWESVWVPRYVGFVWPAVAVVAAASLDRLPTAAVRWSALGLLLAMNLSLFAFRLFGSTEPPVDRMAADVWAAQPRDGRPSDTLTWADLRPAHGGNGGGNLFSDPGRFYLERLADRPMSPELFEASLETFTIHSGNPRFGLPATVSRAGPSLRRVILWEQPDRPDAPAVTPQLPGWRVASDETSVVRDVWTGQDLTWYRRRAYERSSSQ
jgi:hypothetical protein